MRIRFIVVMLLLLMGLGGVAQAQAPEGQPYTVQPGDSLAGIAAQLLGSPDAFPDIVAATNARAAEDSAIDPIADPNLIVVGQTLWIPAGEGPAVELGPAEGPAGSYTAELPAASGPTRLIEVELNPDGSVVWGTDFQNDEPPIEEVGTWTDNGDGTLTVTRTGRADGTLYEAPDTITFAVDDEGTLTALEYDEALYGSEGISLQRVLTTAPLETTVIRDNVIGIYKAMLPGGSSPGLDQTLYLNFDDSARLVSDYLNDEPLIVETGRWSLAGEQVTVTLTGQADRPYDAPAVTRYTVDEGVLVEAFDEPRPGAYVSHFYSIDLLMLEAAPLPYDAQAAQAAIEAGVNGNYKAFAPAATCCGRDLTLTLGPEGAAILETDFMNNEPPIVRRGSWASVGEGRIDLTFEEAGSPLMLELVDGLLRTTADEDEYGEAGLEFYEFGTIALNANLPVVSGTINYQQRIALPPQALITVQLVDTSLSDAPAPVLSEQVLTAGGQQPPFGFELPYNPRTFDLERRYAVQARIEVDGRLQFISTEAVPVLTQGAPQTVELTLNPAESLSAAAAEAGCAAIPAELSEETPPTRDSYLAFGTEAASNVSGLEQVGSTISVDPEAEDSAAAWRDALLSSLGYCGADVGAEQVTFYTPSPTQTVAIIQDEVFGDDSVAAEELRLDLTAQADGQWRIEWGGVRFRCARGANTTDFVAELCP